MLSRDGDTQSKPGAHSGVLPLVYLVRVGLLAGCGKSSGSPSGAAGNGSGAAGSTGAA